MRCPICQHKETYVKDSRTIQEATSVKRRRGCLQCGAKFTTVEKVQYRKLFVIKKSGVRCLFNRNNLVTSITTAVRKRPIENSQIENMADKIIRELEVSATKDIPTSRIGELVMQNLASLDPVAYVRFASVYQDFNSTRDFTLFIQKFSKPIN